LNSMGLRELAALAAVLAAVAALVAFHNLQRAQVESAKERRLALYTSLGLTREQAELFVARFPTNDNETWLAFARLWLQNRSLAEAAYRLMGSVKDAVEYVRAVERARYELAVVDVRGASLLDPRLLTLVTLQGLVNREAPRLYIIFKDVDEWWLASAARDLGIRVRFVGLDEAVRMFAKAAAGYVVYDPALPDTINVGTTLCGIHDAVLVHPTWARWVEELGVARKLFDLRGNFSDRVAAYTWLLENYWSKVDHTKLAVASTEYRTYSRYGRTFTSNIQVACRDYAVALKLLTVYLDPLERRERELLERILSMMPNNSWVLGWYGEDEGEYVSLATRYGKYVAVMMHHFGPTNFANPTVWMHLRPPVEPRFPMPPVRPEVLGRGGIYITFYITDGDNLQWDHDMIVLWRRRAGVPVAWTVSPFLLDVAPYMVYYYAKTASENDTFVCGPSGAGYIYPAQNKAYMRQYLPFTLPRLERSGLRIVEVLGYDDEVGSAYASQLSPWLLAVKRDYNELPGLFKTYGRSFYYVEGGGATLPVLFGALHFKSGDLRAFASQLDQLAELYRRGEWELRYNPATELPGFGDKVSDPDSPTGGARVARAGSTLGGALVYGPYTELPAGTYRVRYALKVGALTEARVATIDVCTDIGRTIIARRDVSGREFSKAGAYQWFELEFTIDRPTPNLEFRVFYDPGSNVDLYVGAIEVLGAKLGPRVPVVLVISQPWDVSEFEGLRRLLDSRPQFTPINLHELVALVNVEYGYRVATRLLDERAASGRLSQSRASELKALLDEALRLYRGGRPYDAVLTMVEFYRGLAAGKG